MEGVGQLTRLHGIYTPRRLGAVLPPNFLGGNVFVGYTRTYGKLLENERQFSGGVLMCSLPEYQAGSAPPDKMFF